MSWPPESSSTLVRVENETNAAKTQRNPGGTPDAVCEKPAIWEKTLFSSIRTQAYKLHRNSLKTTIFRSKSGWVRDQILIQSRICGWTEKDSVVSAFVKRNGDCPDVQSITSHTLDPELKLHPTLRLRYTDMEGWIRPGKTSFHLYIKSFLFCFFLLISVKRATWTLLWSSIVNMKTSNGVNLFDLYRAVVSLHCWDGPLSKEKGVDKDHTGN